MCYHIGVMAKVAPEIKTRLMAEGTWNDFTRFRRDRQKEGETPAAAMRLAVAKFCPDLAGLPPCSHRKGAKDARELAKPPASSVVPARPAQETGVSLDTSHLLFTRRTTAAWVGYCTAGVVYASDVIGVKTCTMAKALDWVIDMMALDPSQVRPDTAPAAKAWSLYLMCRRSPSFAEDVISKAVVRQLPNGSREEENGDEDFAGEREYRLLEALKGEGVA